MKHLSIIFFVIIITSCSYKEHKIIKNDQKTEIKMGLMENSEIKEISERLKEGMIDFIEPSETSYNKNDVETCMNLISQHLQEIEKVETKDEAMKIVEKTVLSLNTLNEKCEHELIETDQREGIAEIIILAGNLKGFNSKEEDVTEEWREW